MLLLLLLGKVPAAPLRVQPEVRAYSRTCYDHLLRFRTVFIVWYPKRARAVLRDCLTAIAALAGMVGTRSIDVTQLIDVTRFIGVIHIHISSMLERWWLAPS